MAPTTLAPQPLALDAQALAVLLYADRDDALHRFLLWLEAGWLEHDIPRVREARWTTPERLTPEEFRPDAEGAFDLDAELEGTAEDASPPARASMEDAVAGGVEAFRDRQTEREARLKELRALGLGAPPWYLVTNPELLKEVIDLLSDLHAHEHDRLLPWGEAGAAVAVVHAQSDVVGEPLTVVVTHAGRPVGPHDARYRVLAVALLVGARQVGAEGSALVGADPHRYESGSRVVDVVRLHALVDRLPG
ncbi:MAG TPA: hypothetical protein VFG42_18430 [Baekduia sp.]|uniref:hypothetical protein n=1 Tax=Baekduia sp. TaxID=2600305 RepID=UPI002D7747E1|nr:hypothetical protein [Baekduia sp.]HET6508777.1 hypothetical protein [Baekduia sp.]